MALVVHIQDLLLEFQCLASVLCWLRKHNIGFHGNLSSSYNEVQGRLWLETAVQNTARVRQYQVLCMFEVLEVLCEKASLRLLPQPTT
jgi:hypothetical protein